MSIHPTKSLERKAYAGVIVIWLTLFLCGVPDSITIAMTLTIIIWAIFNHLRQPQTAEQESLDALDFTSLNLSPRPVTPPPLKLNDQA